MGVKNECQGKKLKGAAKRPPPSLFRVKGIHELNECQILIVHLLEIRGVTQQGLHVNDEIK